MVKPVTTILLLLCGVLKLQAQSKPADSALVTGANSYAVAYFNKSVGQQSEIYNGAEYIALPPAVQGSPYWQDKDTFTSSAIKYNGTWYNGVPLMFDVFKNQIVTVQPVNNYRIILQQYLLSDFIIADHHFVYVNEADSVKQQLKPAYYDVLYSGKTSVLSHYSKERSESTNIHGVEVRFIDHVNYYIIKDKVVYNVSGKGSVLKVFKDKKKELNAYLSANAIKFNDNKALAISKLSAYYDQLTR
ncbi:hypothetical protein [Mucilaginibacter aquatilis]|uniref:WG repeat-containing protein n=1 Tax=Mucilaginibacter aquatilis TaxID=1517760 RepID=A0A6I4I6H3_9SPHI|nr:hypothetical protein [Mucilaginibacter aquatilis]MVN90691.1 hypothetical protein [Mucilaginibacter aquatilis]